MTQQEQKKLVEDRFQELLQLMTDSFRNSKDPAPESLEFLWDNLDKVKSTAIGYDNGYANFIYRLQVPDVNKTVIVKWSRLLLRIQEVHDIGITAEKYDLQGLLQRNVIESRAIELIHKLVPGSTPRVLYADNERYFFIMEDLHGYVTFKNQMNDGIVTPEVFRKIGKFMSQLHRASHINTIKEEAFSKLDHQTGRDTALDRVATSWFYEEIFTDIKRCRNTKALAPVLPQIINNKEMRPIIVELKKKYKEELVCLLHNDLHFDNVFVGPGNEVKFLDLEGCRVGYPAKEVGHFLGDVIVWYYVSRGRRDYAACDTIKKCSENLVKDYMEDMKGLLDEKDFLHYTSGIAGLFTGVRTVNLMPFPAFEGLEEDEAECVQVAVNLLTHMRNIDSVEKFMDVAFTPPQK